MIRSAARLQREFAFVFVIAVVILGALAWSTHEQSVRLDETAGLSDRTRASVAGIQAVALGALAAESAQRGALLGAPVDAARYRQAIAATRHNLDTLAANVVVDPQQFARLGTLRAAVEAQVAQFDQAVALAPTQPDRARALALDDAGPAGRDIQAIAAAMVASETHRFDERVVVRRAFRHATETRTGITLMLLLVALAGGAIFILRELKLRATTNAALVKSRAQLELGERRLRAIADNMPA